MDYVQTQLLFLHSSFPMRSYPKYFTERKCLKLFSVLLFISAIIFISTGSLYAPETNFEAKPINYSSEEKIKVSENSKIAGSKIKFSPAADALPRNGSVFCWVLTSPKHFETRVPAVNETWLKRCDHGQFFTTEPMKDPWIPFTTVFADMDDSYGALFYKTQKAFHYAYTQISDKFDWYMKADDDTYVIMEHLKDYLSQFDPKKPYYLGYTYKYLVEKFQKRRAGYLVSNKALKIFVEEIHGNNKLCPFHKSEDLAFGRCLASKGIFPLDTRNANKQHRFSPQSMNITYENTFDDPVMIKWPEKRKYEAFASELITFHNVKPAEMRMIEILLYIVNDPRRSKFYKQ